MMTELKLLDGASFYVFPHAVLAIGPAETCEECGALASRLFLAGGAVEVAGAVDDVRAALFPQPAPIHAKPEHEWDHIDSFIKSGTFSDTGHSLSVDGVYLAYLTFCAGNSIRHFTRRHFVQAMASRGFVPESTGMGRVYPAMGLAAPFTTDAAE